MEHRSEIDYLVTMVSHAMKNGLLPQNESFINDLLNGNNTQNQYILDWSTHALPLGELDEQNTNNYLNINLNTASSQALDNFGDLMNVHRVSAQPALVELSVSLPVPSDSNITVPIGTQVLIESIFDSSLFEFVTRDEFILPTGSTSGVVIAENLISGFVGVLPNGSVTGLSGFPTLAVSNPEDSSTGQDIEEDDAYRERIRRWLLINTKGTRDCLVAYLDSYEGLDDYNLVPRYDGVGTLKIICDTIPSELENIARGVDENCMLETDYPTVCVLHETNTISQVELTVTKGELGTLTQGELSQIITTQVMTFIAGGNKRDGSSYRGMRIGEDFHPSQLVQFLMSQLPEVLNIAIDMSSVSVDVDEKLVVEEVTVDYET